MTVCDPLSGNLFRLRGLTVDQSAHLQGEQVLALRGLEAREPPTSLTKEDWPRHQATWFSASRPLDRQCLQDLAEGREWPAFQKWESDGALESKHNLAVLEHLWLMRAPENLEQWRRSFVRWTDLAARTSHPGYVWVAQQLELELLRRAQEGLTRSRPQETRQALEILKLGLIPHRFEEVERSLFADDLESLKFRCATVRQQLLGETSREELEYLEHRLWDEVIPLAEMVSKASLPDGIIHYEVLRQITLVYRSLSRGWRELPDGRDHQLKALEQACNWAPLDLRDEVFPELESVRNQHIRPEATILEMAPLTVGKLNKSAWLGAVIVALTFCLFVVTYQKGTVRSFPAAATDKRIRQVLRDIDRTLADIQRLDAARQKAGPENKTALEARLDRTRERHRQLVSELERLQNARNRRR